jgi:hypothetical protein
MKAKRGCSIDATIAARKDWAASAASTRVS